jgi:RDD family
MRQPSTAAGKDVRSRRYRVGVAERRWSGSWLSGVTSAGDRSQYPGERLGLPQSGAGSVAGIGRRLGALMIDWLLCTAIALAVFHDQYWTIVVFAAEIYVLIALTGFTVGKRLLSVRVVRLDGKPVGLFWSLVRAVLFLVVIPPLIFDQDQRGLHDKAANTVVIRI